MRFVIRKGARSGEQIAVPSTLDPETWTFMVVAGATLMRVFYKCNTKEPNNPQIVATRKQGMGPVHLLHKEAPDDIILYYKDEENEENQGGVPRTFYEEYETVPRVDAVWKTSRNAFMARLKDADKTKPQGQLQDAELATDSLAADEHQDGEEDNCDEPASKRRRTQAGDETAKQMMITSDFPGKYGGMYSVFKRCKGSRGKLTSRGIYIFLINIS